MEVGVGVGESSTGGGERLHAALRAGLSTQVRGESA